MFGLRCAIAFLVATAFAAVAENAAAGPPDYGRCVRKTLTGGEGFSNVNCTTKVSAGAKYEWRVGAADGVVFTTKSREGGNLKLETRKPLPRRHVECRGHAPHAAEEGTGRILNETEIEASFTAYGCDLLSKPCTTPGRAAGVIAFEPLQGALGIIKQEANPLLTKVGSSLYRKGDHGGEVAHFDCGGFSVVVRGTVLFPVLTNKTELSAMTFSARHSKQSPEKFEGSRGEILEARLGDPYEQAGLSMTLTQTASEPVEINTIA